MRTKKILLFLSVFCLLFALGAGFYRGNYGYIEVLGEALAYKPEKFDNLIVSARDNPGLSYDIRGYKREGVIYLFLPGTADLKRVVYYAADGEGRYMKRFVHNLEAEKPQILGYRVVALKSGLPALYLDIEEDYGSMEEVLADEKHQTYAYGNMRLDVPGETAERLGCERAYLSVENDSSLPGTAGIRGRGNKTWELEKRPFQLELEKKQDLLGMGKAKKWVLLANAMDDSLLKNKVLYKTADRIGIPYSAEAEPVDLYINGEYQGSYLLATKLETADNRVAIDEQEDFLLEWGGTNAKLNMEFERTANMPYWWIKSHTLRSAQAVKDLQPRIQEILDQITDLDSDAYAGSIDLESFARHYWIQELCVNGDAVFTSIFMYYKAAEDKLYMGPVWDLDNSCGYPPEEEHHYPTGWATRKEGFYTYLFGHEDFAREVERVYREDMLEEAFQETLADLDRSEEYLYSSAVMDYLRWKQPHEGAMTAGEAGAAYTASVDEVRGWLETRVNWIGAEMEREDGTLQK